MLVSNLQQFIRLLVPPLTATGINQTAANNVTRQLEAMAAAFEPFREMDVDRLVELLQILEQYRGREIPEWVFAQKAAPKKSRAPKAPKISVDEAVDKLRQLQQRARSMEPAAIEAEVMTLKPLTVTDLKKVQTEFLGGVVGKKKDELLAALVKKIEDVRASHDRSAEILSFR